METILTVSELNREARRIIEQRFPLLWVSGEIANLTQASSGHVYFTLKDAAAQVRCVMFRSRAQLLSWRLQVGDQVEAQALPGIYEARGEFQLNVEGMRRAGLGRLYELFIKLQRQLAAEGLFAAERKQALPRLPRRIGVITSPQAAALQDVLAALARRAPQVELILYPAAVQGGEAAATLVAALDAAERRRECDVLLLVRGGGGIEDLWAFNDETLARRLAAMTLPVICGVGHESDHCIADLAADHRAATPTAAAELASAGWLQAAAEVDALLTALRGAWRNILQERMQKLDRLALRLRHPARRLADSSQHLDRLTRRLDEVVQRRCAADRRRLAALQLRLAAGRPDASAAQNRLARLASALRQGARDVLARQQRRLDRCDTALTALSPHAILQRGYSIVRDEHNVIVRSAAQLPTGARARLSFASGGADAVITASRDEESL